MENVVAEEVKDFTEKARKGLLAWHLTEQRQNDVTELQS